MAKVANIIVKNCKIMCFVNKSLFFIKTLYLMLVTTLQSLILIGKNGLVSKDPLCNNLDCNLCIVHTFFHPRILIKKSRNTLMKKQSFVKLHLHLMSWKPFITSTRMPPIFSCVDVTHYPIILIIN